MSVLRIEDGRGNCKEPVETDGHKVKDGGCATSDVHGEVEITDSVREIPLTPMGLKCG